jgi:tRNA A-37 threonylcarbamoyl transferase component Bud32
MLEELIGQTLGQYQIHELIGQGGMARVFKAYQPALDRYVAIKALPTRLDNVQDQELLKRFYIEARLVAKLSHPHIVPLHDFGEDQGWAYIVMEYIAGGTVREQLVRAEQAYARLSLPWILKVVEQAALALDFAHLNGVVHRDVKPGNMLLRSEDFLLLSDFGIATILQSSLALSRTGETVGTPQYMAPEQGMPNGAIDGRTDIYSLGAVLYHCVTGRLPFAADTPIGIIMKHIQEPLPRPSLYVPSLSPRVEQIILTALAKDPDQRYQRAADMAAELQVAQDELRMAGPARLLYPFQTQPAHGRPSGPNADYAGHGARYDAAYPVMNAPRGVPGAPGACFRCGAANNPQSRFCTRCGYDLSGARAQNDRYILPDGRTLLARVTFRNGPLAGMGFMLHQDETTLGRKPGNDIVIQDGTVSRHGHAKLIFHQGVWFIQDLDSSNGTFVNNTRIVQPVPLQSGDEVRLGDVIMSFETLAA